MCFYKTIKIYYQNLFLFSLSLFMIYYNLYFYKAFNFNLLLRKILLKYYLMLLLTLIHFTGSSSYYSRVSVKSISNSPIRMGKSSPEVFPRARQKQNRG